MCEPLQTSGSDYWADDVLEPVRCSGSDLDVGSWLGARRSGVNGEPLTNTLFHELHVPLGHSQNGLTRRY